MSTADIEPDAASAPPASMKSGGRRFGDALFNALSVGSGLLIFVTLAAVAIFLTLESLPAILASQEFSGSADFSLIEYSLPLVFGTVLASAIALVIAIPISLGIALFGSIFISRLTGQLASVDDELTGRENLVLLGRLLGFKTKAARERAAGSPPTPIRFDSTRAREPDPAAAHLISASSSRISAESSRSLIARRSFSLHR